MSRKGIIHQSGKSGWQPSPLLLGFLLPPVVAAAVWLAFRGPGVWTATGRNGAYAGSETCRECHKAAYEAWQGSNHALAERLPGKELDSTAFTPPRRFSHGSQETSVGASNGVFHVAATGLSGGIETCAVVRVIGHYPLRQYLVGFPGGRLQTLEASYDPRSNDWFNVYGSEDRRPGEWGHWTGRGMNWNNMCANCHNTRLKKNYDADADTYQTGMKEMGVGCEACHGPLGAHVQWRRRYPDTKKKDRTIPRMTRGSYMETCGQCHSRRMELTGDFVPGDRYDDHHLLTLPDHTDVYYADGQVRGENYEYAAFLGSRMASAGVTCADCHSPHSAKLLLPGNLACMRCHGGGYTNAPVINPVTHSFHVVDALYTNMPGGNLAALAERDPEVVARSGGECKNCHMPQTFYMQRHRRHDHGQTIPDPLLTKEFGIPNACNRCHADKDTSWALAWTEKWYGSKMDRPYRRQAQLAAAARAGDSRALEGLLAMMSTDSNQYWRAVAAGLLEPWSDSPAVTRALTAALQQSNSLVRTYAARSLDRSAPLGTDPAAAAALQRALADPVRSVRYSAQWSLRASLDPGSAADRELRGILSYSSDQPVGRMQSGAYELALGNLAAAAAHYQTAVLWDPNSAPIRHDYAVVLSMQGNGAAAVRELEAACRIDPTEAEYRYKLGLALHESGRTADAIASLQQSVKLDARHDRAWYNLGLALAAENRLADAAGALRRASEIQTSSPDAAYALATVLARQGLRGPALEAIARALAINPDHMPSRQLRATLGAPAQ